TRAGTHQKFAASQIVFREGDPGDALYVVLSGRATVERIDAQGQTVELAKLGPGDFFGDLALIDGAPRSAPGSAGAPVECFMISRTDFLATAARSTGMLANLLVGLSTKVRSISEHVVELALKQERLRAQTEIERHRSIAQMVAGVAHEINT